MINLIRHKKYHIMENKELEEVILDFGKQMGLTDLSLDFNEQLQIELESGETLHLELTDKTMLVYLSFELLPYIVTRTLEKLYIETNYKEKNTEPMKIGLYNSNIVLAIHIDLIKLTVTQLAQTVESLWNFKNEILPQQ